jgi:ABC-type Zn uptake system ZnuABC Zn-binding protein ZnuA
VGKEVNPSTSRQVAEDTGVELVFIYSGSLGEAGSGVDTYLEWLRYNVRAIVEALK